MERVILSKYGDIVKISCPDDLCVPEEQEVATQDPDVNSDEKENGALKIGLERRLGIDGEVIFRSVTIFTKDGKVSEGLQRYFQGAPQDLGTITDCLVDFYQANPYSNNSEGLDNLIVNLDALRNSK